MDELKKAYEAIKMLENLGLPVSKEQKDAVAQMEKDYLKMEIMPLIEQELQNMVEGFLSEFYIYASYSKDNGVKLTLVDHSSKNDLSDSAATRKNSSKSKRFIIRVVFPDGRAICHKLVLQTLIDVVEYAGAENVRKLNIPAIAGCDFISDSVIGHPRYGIGQKRLSIGQYVQTYSSTDTKFEQINMINKKLSLGLSVEKVIIDRPEY